MSWEGQEESVHGGGGTYKHRANIVKTFSSQKKATQSVTKYQIFGPSRVSWDDGKASLLGDVTPARPYLGAKME